MSPYDFSTEYFIPIKSYPHGIPLKCNNNTITSGKIIVCNYQVNSKFNIKKAFNKLIFQQFLHGLYYVLINYLICNLNLEVVLLKKKCSFCDLWFGYSDLNQINTQINTQLNVIVNDYFAFNILTTQVQVKNDSLFEFVYLFDVWVNY